MKTEKTKFEPLTPKIKKAKAKSEHLKPKTEDIKGEI